MQEAYWTTIDWKSVTAGASVLGALALPFIKDLYINWRSGRTAETQSGAKAAETAAERIDRLHAEEYARLATDRDYWQRRATEAEDDSKKTDAEAEDARRDGQAMEEWAHWFRHAGVNTAQRFHALLGLCSRVALGELAPERFAELVKQIQADPLISLPRVPILRLASSTPPPEP